MARFCIARVCWSYVDTQVYRKGTLGLDHAGERFLSGFDDPRSTEGHLQHGAQILAKECRGHANIRVNVVSSGNTATGMPGSSIAAGMYDRYLQDDTIARYGRAIEIARAVRFFLERDNYVTRQVRASMAA